MILLTKFIVHIILYAIYYLVLSTRNIALHNLSRTSVIITMTYIVVMMLMSAVYGCFELGKKKSKPIIYSSTITVYLTVLVTYLQLMIMNTNPANDFRFRIADLDLLVLVMSFQLAVIIFYSYIGNRFYFFLNKPLKTLFVFDTKSSATYKHEMTNAQQHIARYRLQYNVIGSTDASTFNLLDYPDGIDYLIFLDVSADKRKPIIDICYENRIDFVFAPTMTEIIELSGQQTFFGDLTVVDVHISGLTLEQKLLKRIFDIVFSFIFIVLTFPICLLICLLIKLDDGGPVFFVQDRYTINFKVFKVFKFRSMIKDVQNYSSTLDDERVTRFGKFLRKTRLDEIPQFLNVFMGDMSIVGPRPEMIENTKEYLKELPEFRYRLRLKAGLTGLAQIEGKYNTTPLNKLLMDINYIENYNIWQDIKLILKTVIVIFKKDSTEGFENNKE